MNIRIILLLIWCICSVHAAYAQVSFTTLYTKEGIETKNPEEAHYYREISLAENSQVQVIEKYIENNKTKLIGTFPSFKDRIFIGQKLQAYEDGKIKSKEFFSHDGVLIDTALYYHPSGKLRIAYQYPYKTEKNATTVTDTLILAYSDSLGNRTLFNGNGYAELLSSNKTIERGNFENHKKTGRWSGEFMNSKYTFEETYDKGKLINGYSKDSLDNEIPYDNSNFMKPPEYPNGINALRVFIANSYQYPREAIQNRVKGTVKVSFIINQEGQMVDMKVEEDLGYGTGAEALRVLKRAKKWTPGIMRGVPVRVVYSLPIRLDLTSLR